MQRHAFAMEIKDNKTFLFRSNLGKLWKELTLFLDEKKISNFSMWSVKRIVFGYYETGDDFIFSQQDRKKVKQWEEECQDSFCWISVPFEEMRLMYHDFGIVRKSKELIRHRVFITKLVPGAEEEYKARHDALITARGENITEGPDSNFSIWSAGGYIFGYNEIDTTMERDKTQEDCRKDIAWETKMLEIMSWLTNDVDWITGQCHETIQRICWHN